MNTGSESKVLFVDDEPMNLFFFRQLFQEDFNVLTAKSGEEAIALFKKDQEIKVVLTDFKMPEMNGVEMIQQLKSIRKELPCILVSGFALEEEVANAQQNNLIEKVISKPYTEKTIIDTIRKFIPE